MQLRDRTLKLIPHNSAVPITSIRFTVLQHNPSRCINLPIVRSHSLVASRNIDNDFGIGVCEKRHI